MNEFLERRGNEFISVAQRQSGELVTLDAHSCGSMEPPEKSVRHAVDRAVPSSNLGRDSFIVFDLFCGLGGWSEAFIESGFRAIGFDIEAHDYGSGGYPGTLVVKDIRSINGAVIVAAYGVPACIVASPPCQEFSYMAMPWSKAKAKMAKILADPAEQVRLKELFNECFRIQREVSEAAGHYVPMVVENVRGAQRWVGRARWNFGSFYLWGDVPALMPIPAKAFKCAPWMTAPRSEGHKTAGMNWSDQTKRGQDFTRIAGMQNDGVKGFKRQWNTSPHALLPSASPRRKQASAEIAKIPRPLAQWIARCFKQAKRE